MVAPPPSLRRLMFPRMTSTAAEQAGPAAGAAFAVATSGRIVGGGAILSALGYMIAAGAVLVRVPQTLRMWRTKEATGALNPLSTEVEMFFYAAQVLNGLRIKSPLHAWVDDLAHLVLGAATTAMLYAYAKPDSTQSVTKTRKATTWVLFIAMIISGIPGLLSSNAGHCMHQFFELVPPLPPTWRLLLRFAM
eukprot:COSAG02_NODE_2196_length_9548_cov_2.748227_1_plen_192_part_00